MRILGTETKLYKFLEKIYYLMKLNFFIFIFSITIVGLGSSIATGFYFMNKIFKNGSEPTLKKFYNSFKENFRKGLIFSAPIILINFVIIIMFFQGLTGGTSFTKLLLIIIFIVQLNLFFTILMVVGLIDMGIKNILFFSLFVFSKRFPLLVCGNIILYFMLKLITSFIAGIFIFFNYTFVMLLFYAVFHKIMNDEKYFGDKHKTKKNN